MLGVKSSTPFELQAPPRGLGASQTVTGAPPAVSTIFSFPAEKKATLRLSGDQKGNDAFSLPSKACISPDSRDRNQIRSPAPNATLVPSGEITGGAPTSPVS